ncbi:hypothetical protein IAT38_008124 [Cryptococcus sp. DSM 104549]
MSTVVEPYQGGQESGGDGASVHGDANRRNTSPLSDPPSSHHSPDQLSRRTPSNSPPAATIPALPGSLTAIVPDGATSTSSRSPEKPNETAVGLIPQPGGYQALAGEAAIDPSLRELEAVPVEVDLSKTAPAGDAALGEAANGAGVGAGVNGTNEPFLPQTQNLPWLPSFPLQSHSNPNPAAPGPTQPNSTDSSPWALQTNLPSLPSTQPPSSASESPASPFPGGEWPGSFDGSVTDLGSYASGVTGATGATGATRTGAGTGDKGMSAASSESGFEGGSVAGGEGGKDVPPPKKKSHARKQPEGHIKRARNAFILFRKHITDSNLIPPSVEVKHQNISVVAAKMWKEAPQEVRQKFQEQARLEKEEHQRKYPGYRYQPVFRRTDIIRRRVRKDPAEDEKVDAVAEALIKGKAGGALEKEIKEQLVTRSEASESDAESSRGSRRRRREVGQLSKGAIRAQRAQARAKQMRQNLLGSNLLNMSLYNAANSRLASNPNGYPSHPGAAHAAAAAAAGHGQHPGMGYQMDYMPMGYDLEGRPIAMGGAGGGGYAQDVYGVAPAPQHPGQETDMYRLPPIDGMMGMPQAGYEWQQPGMEYWEQPAGGVAPEMMPQQAGYGVPAEEYYAPSYEMEPGMHEAGMEYRLPPLMETSRDGGVPGGSSGDRAPGDIIAGDYAANSAGGNIGERGIPGMRDWAVEGQQTPSGHVMFNERLFDGALGSAGLQGRGEAEDALGMFDQAMEHAGEVAQW